MHTFFPIGVMTGSIMTAPFLRNGTGETNSTDSPDVEWTPDEAASFFESLFITSKYSRLWIVYSLLSAFKLFTAVVIFIAYCVKVSAATGAENFEIIKKQLLSCCRSTN